MLGPAAAILAALAAAPPLVDAHALDPDAILDVRYATADNVTARPLYPVARCLLLPGPAGRLQRAAARLRAQGFRLVLHDCYRPLSVQRALWAVAPSGGGGGGRVTGGAEAGVAVRAPPVSWTVP